ncbi:hypothetical protein BDL97_01G205700 [Sphagnum fallax]|jgi:hypothetical protein|nr:hypothetical protein BDL97_01G205700 [Sphagnum fallax]
MIFFEILTGEIPFENVPLRNVLQSIHDRMRPQLPDADYCPGYLSALIETCWATDATERPQFPIICQLLLDYRAMFLKHPCSQEDVPLDYPEHQGALVQPRLFGSLKDVASHYGDVEYGGELVKEMNLHSFNSSTFMLCGGSSAFEFEKRSGI